MNNMLQPGNNIMGQFGVRPIPYSNYLTNKIVVNNIEDVKQYPVPPGGDYVFIHNTQPILFRKVVDAYGQFTITEFDINQREIKENLPNSQYVSLSEFEKLKAEFDALKTKTEVSNESVE